MPAFSVKPTDGGGAEISYTQAPLLTLLGARQMLGALAFSSYFFYWIVGSLALLALVQLSCLSTRTAIVLVVAYLASFAVYKPQLSRGWPFEWFLYGPLTDWVLGYHGARCVREGPPLDPARPYLFCMAPHGVFGVRCDDAASTFRSFSRLLLSPAYACSRLLPPSLALPRPALAVGRSAAPSRAARSGARSSPPLRCAAAESHVT